MAEVLNRVAAGWWLWSRAGLELKGAADAHELLERGQIIGKPTLRP